MAAPCDHRSGLISVPDYQHPSRIERLFGTVLVALLRLGIGLPHMRILEVRGRTTGRHYSVPVDLLLVDGKAYLVAPRGYTQWVRNVEAGGEVTLRRGRRADRYAVRALSEVEKPAVLKSYLDRFRREVQRYFPVRAGAPATEFVPLAGRYPAYELVPKP